MKKIVLLILSIMIAVFSLTGCGKKGVDEEILKVGIDLKYPPFMYMDEKGIPTGLEPDLAYAFGEFLGKDVEIVNTDFSMLMPALETGEIDIVISDMSVNEQRKAKVDFTNGYRYGRTTALVNKDFYNENNITDDMKVGKFFSLENIKCIGLSGTIGTTLPQNYGVRADEATEIATAIMEVTSGRSNVIVGSYVIFGDHAANPDTTEIYLGIPEYSTSSFAVKKGNIELLNKANEFIDTLYEKGGLYEQLADKYDNAIGEVFFNDDFGLNYIITKPE